MRAALIDVDSHNFPNLVLMKLSTWFKAKGYEVDLLTPGDILKGNNLFYDYDEMYGACVFDWNRHTAEQLSELGVYMGGDGYTQQGHAAGRDRTPNAGLFVVRDYRDQLRFSDKRMPTPLSVLYRRQQRGVNIPQGC